MVRGQAQAGDLGEGRVQVLQVGFQGDLGLVRLGNRILGTEPEGRPEAAHARHDAPDARDGVDRRSIALGSLGLVQKGHIGLGDFGVDVL